MSCSRCGLLACSCSSFNRGCGEPGASTGCSPVAPVQCIPDKVCGACPEDHTNTIVVQEFASTLRVSNSWNIPAVSGFATLKIPGLVSAPVGEWLHNPNYGFFQITGFNASTNEVTIVNNGNDGNASPGTFVPPCTDFILSTNPCECDNGSSSIFPYVAVDFTAPNNGDCMNITVTTVNGLQVGKNVGIWTGIYRLQGIVSPTVITICNDGDGLAPGTLVVAKDGAGNFQYPVVTIDANPCSSPALTTGSVIVCNTLNQVPLTSSVPADADNVVVVALTGVDLVQANYTPIDAGLRICSVLSAPLSIVNGDATYTISVDDPSVFTNGDILKVEGRTEQFKVTAVGGSTIDVTAVPTPGADATVLVDSWICLETCCENLTLLTGSTFTGNQLIPTSLPFDLSTAHNLMAGNPVTLTVPADPLHNTFITVYINAFLSGSITGGNTNHAKIASRIETRVNGGGYATVQSTTEEFFMFADAATLITRNYQTMEIVTVAPSATPTVVDFRLALDWLGDATAIYATPSTVMEMFYEQSKV